MCPVQALEARYAFRVDTPDPRSLEGTVFADIGVRCQGKCNAYASFSVAIGATNTEGTLQLYGTTGEKSVNEAQINDAACNDCGTVYRLLPGTIREAVQRSSDYLDAWRAARRQPTPAAA